MPSFHDTLSRPVGVALLLAALCPLLGSTPAHAAAGAWAGSDRLLPGETLQPGQSLTGGHDTLTMQANGNLVLSAPGHTPIWTSRTAGNSGASLVMPPSGNLAVVAPGGQALWSAGTGGHSGSMLILLPNGNAVIAAPATTAPPSSAPPSSAPGSAPTSNAPLWSTGTSRQTYADVQLAAHGWSQGQARQFGCLDNIWTRESKWNELAGNPASAYGIPQASPGAKMAAAGPDWLTNPQTQIRWGENYIQGQYGTPCQAWAHWQVYKNY
jgi:hypothetical protein